MQLKINEMKNLSSHKNYIKANNRWPNIKWEYDKYHNHVDGKEVKNPIDMYLAGAAGNRIDEAWLEIEVDLGPKVCQRMESKPKADYTTDDIWSITRLYIMDDDKKKPMLDSDRYPARIIQYQGRSSLLSYLITIACQKANERFRKMEKHNPLSIDNFKSDESSFDPADKIEENPLLQLANEEVILSFQKTLKDAFEKLDPDQKYMLQMVLFQGMKQKDAGKMIGLSETNAARAMKKIKMILSNEMQRYEELWDNNLFRNACKEIMQRCMEE